MSIRVYSVADELDGTTIDKRKCARFELMVAARTNTLSKPLLRKIKFSVAGESDAGVEEAAITIAEEILAMTQAQVLKFSKVLGHYRQDGVVPVIAANQKSTGAVGFSPNPSDGLEAVNLSVNIPWFNGTAVQANALVAERTVQTDEVAGIGYIRWEDQDEDELEAMLGSYYRGLAYVDMEKVYNEPLSTANTENGLGDDHLDADL